MKNHLFGWSLILGITILGITLAFPAHDMSAEEFISPEEAVRQADLLKAQRQQDLMSPEEAVRQADLLQQQRYMSPQEAVQQANRLMQQPGSQQQPQQQMVYGTTGAEPHRPYPAWSAAPQMYQVPYPYQVTQVYQVYVQPLPQYPVYNSNYPYSNYPYYNPYPYTVQPRQSQWEYQVSVQQLPRGYLPQSMRYAQQPEHSEYVPEALAADVDQQETAGQQEVPAAQQPPQQIAAVVVPIPAEPAKDQPATLRIETEHSKTEAVLPATTTEDQQQTIKELSAQHLAAEQAWLQQQERSRKARNWTLFGIFGSVPLLLVIGWSTKKILSEIRLLNQERREFELLKLQRERERLERAADQIIEHEKEE